MTNPMNNPDPNALDLDLETAPDTPKRKMGFRGYVGGVLYIEGIVVFLMGLVLLLSYWPPIAPEHERANPISQFGLWLSGLALFYMVFVGISIFFYNLVKPSPAAEVDVTKYPGIVSRARRYASMKRKTWYIFDNTIECENDAEDAITARELY